MARPSREIEYALRKGLDPDWIKNAQVSVEITSYRSRAIYVIGEVRNPAKYTIEGQTTLLEVIAQAGSFTPNAAQNIIVTRYKEGLAGVVAGTPVAPGDPRGAEILRVNREELSEGKLQANIILQDGDTIFVPAAEKFYVMGLRQEARSIRAAARHDGAPGDLDGRRPDRARLGSPHQDHPQGRTARTSRSTRRCRTSSEPNDTIRVAQRLI